MIEFKIPNEVAPLRAMSDALSAMADAKDGKPRACQCKPTLAEFAGVERAPFQEAHDAALTEQPVATTTEQPVAVQVAATSATMGPAAGQVDAEGCPWDARIHSSGQTLLANGFWRVKGGASVTAQLIATVKAEIMQPVVAATEQPVVAATEQPVVAATEQPVVAATEQPVVAATEQPVVAATEQPVVAATEPTTFPELVKYVVDKKTSGQLTDPQILEAISPLGITAFPQLAARPDLIPQVYAAIEACRTIAS